jgi:replication factor C large subunit
MTGESWVEKHRPEDWDEVQGNNKAIKQIRRWAENWELGDEPQLLVGPPGTGKTTIAYIASDTLGYPLNKVNASLTRTSDELKRVARSMQSSPAGSDHQLILLDEVDNFYHSVNKKPLYDALRSPRNPIILTANDEYDVPDSIKRASTTHEFKLGVRSRKAKIKEIASREGMELQPAELNRLAQRPDLRSAINDLQNAAESDSPIGEDQRTWSEGEFSAMEGLLGGDYEQWFSSMGYEDDTFDDLGSALLWVDENVPQEFRGLEAGIAHQMMAYADFWLGRAWERQEHRYQKYGWAILSNLHEARLSEPYGGYINVSFPTWFRHSKDKPDDSSPEAELYQQLKGADRGYSMAGSFYEFRQRHLPLLLDLSEEDRMELALDAGLSEEAMKALELDPSDFDDWREVESPKEGDGWSPGTQSAASADW